MNGPIINFYSQNKVAAQAGFVPSDITNMIYWHDYTDSSTLDLDTNTFDSVYRVKDKATSNYVFMQPVKSAQPLPGNDGRNYVIPVSATGSGLYATLSQVPTYTICTVIKYHTGASGEFYIEHTDKDCGFIYAFGQPSDRILQFRIDSNKLIRGLSRNPWVQLNDYSASNIQDTNIHLVIYRNNNTAKSLFLDGSKVLDVTTGSNDTISGSYPIGVVTRGGLTYRVYEQFKYNKSISDSEATDIYNYFLSKYS